MFIDFLLVDEPPERCWVLLYGAVTVSAEMEC